MLILDVPQSGSVAGVTSSRNRFGQYRRTRAIPVQPRTPKQGQVRALLAAGSSAWRGLTDAQRTGWNDYAAQIERSNRLGSGYSPTGAALYAGAVILTAAPVVTDPPDALPDYVLQINGMTYTDSTPGPEALTVAIQTTSSSNNVMVETSGPVSPGITSTAAIRRWRSLPLSASNLSPKQYSMAASPIAILTEYKFLFPSPAPGNVIWFRFREISYPGSGAVPVTNTLFQSFRLPIS